MGWVSIDLKLRSNIYITVAALLLALSVQTNNAQSIEEGNNPGKRSEEDLKIIRESGLDPDKISPDAVVIKPPSYTDEEHGSMGLPKVYQCDGCKIIAYQLQVRFSAEEKKKGGKKSLSESETIDVVEALCNDDFEGYGLMSSAAGAKYLVGEGLDTPKASGSVDNGPLWSKRLRRMCLEILDSYDEVELYQLFKSSTLPWDGGRMCSLYCDRPKRRTKTEL